MKLKGTCPLEESYDRPRQRINEQRHHFAAKVHPVKDMVFPVIVYEYESWTRQKTEH